MISRKSKSNLDSGRIESLLRAELSTGSDANKSADAQSPDPESLSERGARQLLVFQKFALDQAAIVAVTDTRGRIVSVNDKFCQISKYSRDELIGQDHRILNSGTHPKQFFKEMYATIARGKVWHGEIRNRAKDGSFYWVDTTIVPVIPDPANGKIIGYIAIRQDITELKKVQESLRLAKETAEAANQAKGEFLANMSHEIRTPMTAIIGYADLLCDTKREPEEKAEFIQTIRRNGEHLLSLINDILDISKIEAGKLLVENMTFDPSRVVSDVESSMRVRAMEKGIGFAVEYKGPAPLILHSDPTRLRQILLNLVSNAVKFTRDGGVRITISYDAPNREMHFAISDTGIGLSPDQQAALFKPFAQADGSTTRRFGGTGLGLVLCKRLVEALGGAITIQSEVGKGSAFQFTVKDQEDTGQQVVSALPPSQSSPGPLAQGQRQLRGRVLLVEDGADNRRLVSIYLEDAGLQVETAVDGAVAIKMIFDAEERGKGYDAVLMDMQMPEMDGYAATAQVRQRGINNLPIIAFTANAMGSEKQKCLSCGCNDYATKPVNPDALIQTLAKFIHQSIKNGSNSMAIPTSSAAAPKSSAADSPSASTDSSIAVVRSQFSDKPAVARVLPEYIAGLPAQVDEIRRQLARRDLNTMRRLVHQLRGSGGAYGFPDVTRLATTAENLVDAKASLADIQASVTDLLDHISRIEGYTPQKTALVA